MTLGLVLATPPERGDCERAERLARAARRRGLEVSIFVMDRAAIWGAGERASALVDEGCEIVLCGTSAAAAGVREAAPGVVIGSQDDHAALVRRADRVVAFT